ncbi:MAG: acyl carrier protein [Xanthobacteraceae bacterium]|nr:acyl carrier protein [Bradyrhizobium sp.]
MTGIDVRKTVLEEINNVAPEVDLATVDPAADLREAIDIDSMDFLNLVTALHRRTSVEIPETDYPKLVTISGMIAYLEAKLG